MIKYKDLVDYIKENHVNWDTELFCVLRDFFAWYMTRQNIPVKTTVQPSIPNPPQPPPQTSSPPDPFYQRVTDFKHPADGEYSTQDLMNLFST